MGAIKTRKRNKGLLRNASRSGDYVQGVKVYQECHSSDRAPKS